MKTRIALAALVAAALLVCPAQATLTSTSSSVSYVGNGSTTSFTVPFKFLASTDLVVTVAGVQKSLNADYTVTGVGNATGSVKFTVAPATSTAVVITRSVPFTQTASIRNALPAPAGATIETALDRQTMLAQQNAAALAALTTKEATDIAAAINPTPVTVNSSSLILPTGGTTSRTIADWQADSQNVKARGVYGDGSHDDTAAIQAVFTNVPASGGTIFFPPGTYNISGAVTLSRAHTHLVGYGAKIVQTGTVKGGFIVTGASSIVEGFWLFNNNGNTDWADSPAGSTNSIGISIGPGADNAKVLNNRVEQFGWSAVKVYQSKYVTISGNELIGIGATKPLVAGNNNNLGVEGYLSGVGYPGLTVINNQIHDFAQGIYVGFDWQDVIITNNVIRDIQGQHCMYLGGAINMVVANNTCKNAGQNGIKVQISSDTTLNPENITITGNTVDAATAAGIIVLPATGGLTPRFKNVSIVGNTIRNSLEGIDVDQVDNFNVANNAITGSTGMGIQTRSNSGSGRVAGNLVVNSQQAAIHLIARSTADLAIVENNFIIDPAQSGTGTSDLRSGIYLSSGEWIARDNVITATNPTPVGFNINLNSTAIATLQRNRTIASKNNVTTGTVVIDGRTTVSAGGTITANAQTTNLYVVSAAGIATAWTHAAPVNPTSDATLTYQVRNTSAGALGVLTWDPIFKMAAWTQPATLTSRAITFRFDGTNWVEVSRTPADVSN